MAGLLSAPVLNTRDGYKRWARGYDTQPNPMLCLERRYLESLIPCAAGLDVVDLGCGTGRWLEILKEEIPRSLLGVDSSPDMLREAKKKLRSHARLVLTDGDFFPVPSASADILLANFVLSYVEDARIFLTNSRNALRPGGSLFLTDLHPETTAALSWRRGIKTEKGFEGFRTFERSIGAVIALCESLDLRLCARLEPWFGAPERKIFQSAGKLSSFDQCADYPAIYILQFHRMPDARASKPHQPCDGSIHVVRRASIALSAEERIAGPLVLSNARIEAIGEAGGANESSEQSKSEIDLKGFLVFPGLVNAHDHLEFALFPRLGRGQYQNALEWAEDIHRSETEIIAAQRQVPKSVRLWWGGIRNLLCGVTTVSHHNPYDSGVFNEEFVIRVLRDYGWAHSLALDADAAKKKHATPPGWPFLIHLGEGIDAGSEEEIDALYRSGGLDKETVIIHGLALNKRGCELLRHTRAGLIWCPTSNVFLFGRTLSGDIIEALPHIALGSDSPLTAKGDLLDEVAFAVRAAQIASESIYRFVTRQSARILRLRHGEGSLQVGGVADFFAVRDRGQSPAETLANLSYQDVELVLVGGRVHLASDEIVRRLPDPSSKGLQPLLIEDSLRWIRAPLDWLFRETEPHLPAGIVLGGKMVRHGIIH